VFEAGSHCNAYVLSGMNDLLTDSKQELHSYYSFTFTQNLVVFGLGFVMLRHSNSIQGINGILFKKARGMILLDVVHILIVFVL
jgi:hypothetical protein